ncbi:hypothetical protein CRYUN_Cryun13aG0120500 [Craigia yunnanensis]
MSVINKTGMPAYLSRYKIYIEGYAWSVSEKCILACDSVTFMVQVQFYDFFMRGMLKKNLLYM